MKNLIKFTKLPIYHQHLCLIVDDNTDVLQLQFSEESVE